MKPAVVAKAFITYNGRLLLLKRSESDQRRPGQYDIPGGEIEVGEEIIAGLLREIKEETGLIARPGDATEINNFGVETNEPGVEKHVFLVVLPASTTPDIKLSAEHSSFGWFSPQQALEAFPHPFYGPALKLLIDNRLLPQ